MSTSGRFFVYLLASRKYGSLYLGMTGNLVARTYIHREDLVPGFTSRYHVHRLVYFEQHETALAAITREKQLKKRRRAWKIELIERDNPDWQDRFEEISSLLFRWSSAPRSSPATPPTHRVIPAKAGTSVSSSCAVRSTEVPAVAGMTCG